MSSAPPPAFLTLLSDLPARETGTKVRFLGCVKCYDTKTGVLSIGCGQHDESQTRVTARVDVRLVLENCKRTDLDVGTWINVIGYIQRVTHGSDREKQTQSRRQPDLKNDDTESVVCIQAIMLWNAGAIKLDKYEKSVRQKTKLAGYNEC